MPNRLLHTALAWFTHLVTASGAVWGLLAINAISKQQFVTALWFMAAAIVIDAGDGTLARLFHTRTLTPQIDGALLDNIVDYLNYTIVPAYFLLGSHLLPGAWQTPLAVWIVLTSAYQFTQTEAKTADHFFKGFPSYWNLVVLYMFLWELPPAVNGGLLVVLGLLVFVPIKYVYPSRLDYLTRRQGLRRLMLGSTILWGMASAWLLWIYPRSSLLATEFMLAFALFYVLVSLYRTFVPLLLDAPTESRPVRRLRRRVLPIKFGR